MYKGKKNSGLEISVKHAAKEFCSVVKGSDAFLPKVARESEGMSHKEQPFPNLSVIC